MSILNTLNQRYVARIDELVQRGKTLSDSILLKPSGDEFDSYYVDQKADFQAVEKWVYNCLSLLGNILPQEGLIGDFAKDLKNIGSDDKYLISLCVSRLEAIKEDFEQGFLRNQVSYIEAEISADYMRQAEQLLQEGQPGKYDHVPAAVLAGVTLERGLRTLCDMQNPPLPTMDPKGNPLMMNRLIDDLKKSQVFNKLKAKQLRAWADIRNKAAHGDFNQFNRSDVEMMLSGIEIFLADYLP